MVPEVRVVYRHGAVELGEHVEKPCAAAPGRAEDPDETILIGREAEAVFVRAPLHVPGANVVDQSLPQATDPKRDGAGHDTASVCGPRTGSACGGIARLD